MSEQTGESFLEPAAAEALVAARAHLDEAGVINYHSFDGDTMHITYLEVGHVGQLVPEEGNIDQLPAEIIDGQHRTSAQRFVEESNNFDVFFRKGWLADLYRTKTVYRRFQLLFPELASAARTALSGYHERRHAAALQGESSYHEEDTAVFMQGLYGIMRQLIDVNDPEVIESPETAGYLLWT